MASVVAYNPVTKTWGARPSVGLSTTVVYAGPLDAPTPTSKQPCDIVLADIIRAAAALGDGYAGY